jgi:hypothetical protein
VEASRWAVEEFGQAAFGDARLQRRILDLAATAATRPAARITQLYESTAQRRGAYRALNHSEEFHRGWKSGGTQLQTSQLRSQDALLNLAVILASVAMRAMALRDESRANPQQPATVALSEVELDTLYVLWKKRKRRRKEMPTLQQAVEWIARLGGYTGKSSGGPPGVQVINRGLSRLEVGVQMLNTLSQPTEKVEKERSDQ